MANPGHPARGQCIPGTHPIPLAHPGCGSTYLQFKLRCCFSSSQTSSATNGCVRAVLLPPIGYRRIDVIKSGVKQHAIVTSWKIPDVPHGHLSTLAAKSPLSIPCGAAAGTSFSGRSMALHKFSPIKD